MINVPRRTTFYVAIGCLLVLAVGGFLASRTDQPHPSFPYRRALILQGPADPDCGPASMFVLKNGLVYRHNCCNSFQYYGRVEGDYIVITGATGSSTLVNCRTETRSTPGLPPVSQKVRWWQEGDFIIMKDQIGVYRFKIEEL